LSPIISALGASHARHQENGQHVAGQKAASLARTQSVLPGRFTTLLPKPEPFVRILKCNLAAITRARWPAPAVVRPSAAPAAPPARWRRAGTILPTP
jgi:hypothetical protein